jgi:hypothetical protein
MKRTWILGLILMVALCLPIVAFAQAPVQGAGQARADSHMIMNGDIPVRALVENHWVVECYDQFGNFKWREEFDNLVVTNGLNELLNKGFKNATQAATWYVGLVGTTSTGFDAGDTMASHAGWAENAAYTLATRPVLTLGSVASGSVDNTASTAPFTMNATTTIYGAFICDSATKSTGVGVSGLYGEGAFTTSRSVISGDILNITITLTVTASDAMDFLYEFVEHVACLIQDRFIEDFRLAA